MRNINMKRFYGDDEDDFDLGDDELEFMEAEEAFATFMDKEDLLNMMQLDLHQIELNQQLMEKAIRIAEKSFWWNWKSPQKKIEDVQVIYERLIEITDSKIDKKEGDEDADL